MKRGALLSVLLLVACGGSAPSAATPAAPEPSLRPLSASEEASVQSALARLHGDGAAVIHAEGVGRPARVLVIYAHTDAPAVPSAGASVCGARAEPVVPALDAGCRYLAIGRLAEDGTTLDARLALGTTCEDEVMNFYADDFDHDGRDEVSLMVGRREAYVFDVTTFGVQFAGPGVEYQLLHPEGTGLVRPVPPRPISETDEVHGYAPYEFEVETDPSQLIRPCEGEPLWVRHRPDDARHDPLELVPYDPSGDCWH